MADFYFFTEPVKLNPQTMGQSFGPSQNGNPNSTGAAKKDKYQITDFHTGNTASAIAVCDGLICVQPDDRGTYSVILKPNYQPAFDFPYIKYFIYKGIMGNSLKKPTSSLEITDDSSIPFAARIRNEWDYDNGNNPITNSANVMGLAYDDSVIQNIGGALINIFTDEQPIDNLFYFSNEDFQLPLVKAGEKIGMFDDSCVGFEIILEKFGYNPEIKLARNYRNYIEVDAILDPLNDNNTWSVNDAEYFMHWHAKEDCLNYMDPCAFYGSFIIDQILVIENGTVIIYKKGDIYTNLLDNLFINKNCAYLEIIGDANFSYNLFGKYSDDVTFSDIRNSSNNQILNSKRSNWPILKILVTEIPGVLKNKIYKSSLILPKGINLNPSIYLSFGYFNKLTAVKNRFVKTEISTNGIELCPVSIAFPAVTSGSVTDFVASFSSISIYELFDRDSIDVNYMLPKRNSEFEWAINLQSIKSTLTFNLNRRFNFCRCKIGVSDPDLEFLDYIANIGIFFDSDNIVFAIFPVNYNPCKTINYRSTDWANSYSPQQVGFLDHFFKSFSSIGFLENVIVAESGQDVYVYEIVSLLNEGTNELYENININNYYFFFLDKQTLKNEMVSVFSQFNECEKFPLFLTLKQNIREESEDGVDYFSTNSFALTGFQKTLNNKIESFTTNITLQSVSHGDL